MIRTRMPQAAPHTIFKASLRLHTRKAKAKKETKRERFVRVAEMRTQKVLDDLKALSKCARHDCYEFSDEDVVRIFEEIEKELLSAKDSFAGLKRFSLGRDKE